MNEKFGDKIKKGIPMMIMGGPRPTLKKPTSENNENLEESISIEL
jgi:hypothetical protein